MSKKITGKVLSVHLGKEESQLVVLDNTDEILYAVSRPTPAGAVEDGVIRNPDAIREMLNEVRKEPEVKKVRKVVFSLCTSQVIKEVVTTPDMPEAKLGKLLRANADMYFPVDTQDYQIVWQVIGPKYTEEGVKELSVQLWAVPAAMITPYYTVANACGLSVAAVDYCGHSIATAVGASYAAPTDGAKESKKLDLRAEITFGKKKPAKAAPVEQAERKILDTDMHLLLDKDVLAMTFVQNGQVVMQRLVPSGNNPRDQFGEMAMTMEYFRSMEAGRGSNIRGIVCGHYTQDSQFMAELAEALGISLVMLDVTYDLRWCLCVGAAWTDLEFGNPALDAPDKTRKQVTNHLWQYGVLLASALALVAVFMFVLSSRLDWDTSLSRLEQEQRNLMLQSQKTSGYADNYQNYLATYNAYSDDWDAVFANLKTYNNNLVLVLDELEKLLPENSTVVGMQIASDGMNVTFACEDKEEAAYLIMALRDMQYADLMAVSDMQGGGKGPATSYGPDGYEAAPVEGSDQSYEQKRLAAAGSIAADLNAYAVGYNLGLGFRTVNYFNEFYQEYSFAPQNEYVSVAALKAAMGPKVTPLKRTYAFYQLCTANPFAIGYAQEILSVDMANDGSLYKYVYKEAEKRGADMMEMISYTSVEDLRADVELLVDIIISADGDYPALDQTEALLCTNPQAEAWYLFYLEALMNQEESELLASKEEIWYEYYQNVQANPGEYIPRPPEVKTPTYLNMDKIIADLADGEFNSAYPKMDKVLNKMISSQTLALIRELYPDGPVTPPTDPTDPIDPTDPTDPSNPSDPSDDPDNPFNDPQYEALIRLYLPIYLRTGKISVPGYDNLDKYIGYLDSYFSTGSSGTEYDRFMDGYLTEGHVDSVVKELLLQYKSDPSALKNPAVRTMFDNYYQLGDTGNDALNAMIARVDQQLEEDGEDQVTRWLKLYLTYGKTYDDTGDAVIQQYLVTGKTSDEEQTQRLDDYVRERKVDPELKNLLYYYLYRKGQIKDESIVTMFDNYYESTTGSEALDERIRQLSKELASSAIQNGGSAGGSGGGGGGAGGSGGAEDLPEDTRIFFAVILNYNNALRDAELNRKGLDSLNKVQPVEVDGK